MRYIGGAAVGALLVLGWLYFANSSAIQQPAQTGTSSDPRGPLADTMERLQLTEVDRAELKKVGISLGTSSNIAVAGPSATQMPPGGRSVVVRRKTKLECEPPRAEETAFARASCDNACKGTLDEKPICFPTKVAHFLLWPCSC